MIRRAVLFAALKASLAAGLLLSGWGLARAESYTVQPGENLYVIAKQRGVSVNDLVRCNRITDQRLIRPGMTLEIPAPASAASQNQVPVAAEARVEPASPQPQKTVAVTSRPRPSVEPRHVARSQHKPAAQSKHLLQPEPARPEPAPIAASTQPAPAPAPRPDEAGPMASQEGPAATAPDSKPLLPLSFDSARESRKPLQLDPPRRKTVSAATVADLTLKLVLVLVFAYLSVWALKRVSQRRGRLLPGRGSMRIVETTSLAPNRGLHLVAVGQRVFMIGSTPENISVLGEVSDVAELSQRLEAKAEKPAFAAQLQALFKRSQPNAGIGGVIASLRDGTFFVKRAAERARAMSGQPGVDARG